METVRQSHKRWKDRCAPVTQQSVPDIPAGLITTISVGIIPPARVVADVLTKTNLREGSPNILMMASSSVGKQETSELMDSRSAGRLSGAENNQPSSSKPRASSMHSSRSSPSGGAAVEIPISQDRKSPIWLCTSLMKMSLPKTHPRLYLLRMPLLFPTFQDKILKGSTMVTSYQQRSANFEGPTIMSQVM